MIHTRHSAISIAAIAFASLLAAATAGAADGYKPDSAKERDLLATLQSGKPAEKAIACKQLARHGSKVAVPELEKLLADEQLASWARIALEAIPDPAADEALRNQLGVLKGNLLIGVVNSIGVRRDAAAVDGLTKYLSDEDLEVVSAAAAALGQIGNEASAKSLEQALASMPDKVRAAVAEGCIICAERHLKGGKLDRAAELYEQVRTAKVPQQRVLEATRGKILARQADGIPLLVAELESDDKRRFQIALGTARELRGAKVTEALTARLGTTKPQRAVLLLSVLADRDDMRITPAVLAAAKSGDKLVRVAAIGLIGRLGDESTLPTLLEIVGGSDAELASAARLAIIALQGEKVDAEIVARLETADGKILPQIIQLVGQRRIDAKEPLTKALEHQDAAVRRAALAALGETIGSKDLSLLITRVVEPKYSADAEAALAAIKAASVRMPDRDACAAELAGVLAKSPKDTQPKLIEILGAVGGEKALESIAAAGKSSDEQLSDAATRVLGQWMNTDAGPVLIDLAKNASTPKFRTRALRGYIRLARQFVTSEEQRAEMCQLALDAATRSEEQKLVFEILERKANLNSLKVALKAVEVPGLRQDASRVAISIAEKLGASPGDAKLLVSNAAFKPDQLEIIKAEYGANERKKDVTAVLKKHFGGMRWIVLPSANFNQSFGGDPAPNVVKQLRVEYRIDGKTGEATFAENTPIILPVPN